MATTKTIGKIIGGLVLGNAALIAAGMVGIAVAVRKTQENGRLKTELESMTDEYYDLVGFGAEMHDQLISTERELSWTQRRLDREREVADFAIAECVAAKAYEIDVQSTIQEADDCIGAQGELIAAQTTHIATQSKVLMGIYEQIMDVRKTAASGRPETVTVPKAEYASDLHVAMPIAFADTKLCYALGEYMASKGNGHAGDVFVFGSDQCCAYWNGVGAYNDAHKFKTSGPLVAALDVVARASS